MSRGTLDPALLPSVSPTGLSPSLAGLSRTVPLQSEVINAVRTPECTHSGLASFAFATAPHLKCLTLLHNVTRWPVLQKVRSHTNNVLLQLVSAGFQVLFHSPPGVLFTFPSRYYTLSVTR